MQAKISEGADCLRFLRVTGGNLPAPVGNSHKIFIVRVQSDFFKPRDVLLIQFQTPWPKWPFVAFEVNGEPFKFDFVPKTFNRSLMAFQTVIQEKTARWRSLHYHQNDREQAVVNFLVSALIPTEGKITSKSRSSVSTFSLRGILVCSLKMLVLFIHRIL